MSEAGAGVVTTTPSNGDMGAASLRVEGEAHTQGGEAVGDALGLPGVVGLACGEGCPEEDGRSHEVPGGEASSKGPSTWGRGAIRVYPETRNGASREVGGVHSSEEPAVMAGDAKVPHFGDAPSGERGRPSHREV